MGSNRRYSFQSVWDIDQPPEKVWQVLTATPFSPPEWWPQLNDVHFLKRTPNLEGTVFTCTWQAPIGYRLRSHITLGPVEYLQRAMLYSEGDLLGTVTCLIRDKGDATHVDIDWQVETTKAWMNRLSFLLRPLFIWGHHAVMRSGERGLRRYMQGKNKALAS